MATVGKTAIVNVRLRWWVLPYVHAVRLFALTFGCEPDVERVVRRLFEWRGIVITLSDGREL